MVAAPRIYNLFPRIAGPMETWKERLPHIAGMGFDWIFINPIQVPGGSGSLYAIRDYYRYNEDFVSAQADGDALLRDFAQACAAAGVGVMMDLVINHTANDSVLVGQHPEWYLRHDNGALVAPSCKLDDGSVVTWGDLAEIAYASEDNRNTLVAYWKDVISHYLGLGVRGFRCDAAYQVPASIWHPLIQAARAQQADVVFAGETLGCSPDEVRALAPAGFDLLFNSSKWWDFQEPWLLDQYEQYRHIAPTIGFPESHDTERMITELGWQGISGLPDVERHYKQRYMFSALFSSGVMMPVGYEYGFRKRLHVVETRPEDWEQPQFDLSDFIARVHRMKTSAPALNEEGPQYRIDFNGDQRFAGLVRRTNDNRHWAVAVINRDMWTRHEAWLPDMGIDLRQGIEISPDRAKEPVPHGQPTVLEPAEIRVFAGPVT
ncbi:hypothetical protein JCM17960_05380 [Magnetospira thiophila]